MTPIAVALAAAIGVHLLYSAYRPGPRPSKAPRRPTGGTRQRIRSWMVQSGLDEVSPIELAFVVSALGAGCGVIGYVVFGAAAPAALIGLVAMAAPVAAYRFRRQKRLAVAQDSWPRMIEEIRVLCSSVGRSIPQALLEVGLRGPVELRDAFEAAQREWLLTTDFERTLEVLTSRLADPTADATAETLLVAHQVGGAELGPRLSALAEDRLQEVNGRKDARAKQAGARFARRFVLLVPLGMAAAGMTVGEGRRAYATAGGQLGVTVALGMILACWVWSGRLMRLPQDDRVLAR